MQYKRLLYQGMASLLVVTTMPISSYAKPADNNVAPSAIYGARINMSIDQKTVKFAPQYFDPNKLYTSSRSVSVSNIPGLSEEQMEVVRKIVSGLQDLNLSNAMLAGILGNIWQETIPDFNPTSLSDSGTFYGLCQWGRERRRALETMPEYDTAETQVKFLKAELQGTMPATMNYGKLVDEYLQKYDNTNMRTVEDVEMACEAFCVKVEGCEGGNDLACDGKNYQGLKNRKEFAKKCFDYLQKGGVASEQVRELFAIAESKLGCKYTWGAEGPNEFDCSGFSGWCLEQMGIHGIMGGGARWTTADWRSQGASRFPTVTYDELQPGDIWVTSGHMGIMAENGLVYDASSSNKKVVHRNLEPWLKNNFVIGFRIFN